VGVRPRINLQVAKLLFRMRADCLQFRHPIDYVNCQGEAIDFILDCQFHGRIDVAALFITAYVQIFVIVPVVGQPVNQPRIAVKAEDDRFVGRKQDCQNRGRSGRADVPYQFAA